VVEWSRILQNLMFQMDLQSFIMKAQCECLNESDEHSLEHGLNSGGGYLQSDCDEQVLVDKNLTTILLCFAFAVNYFNCI
jgi:hypothetical protein